MEGYTMTFVQLSPEELKAVRDLGRRSFPGPLGWLMAAFVTPYGMIIRHKSDGIVGFLSMKFTQIKEQSLGIFEWGMLERQHRRKGLAKEGVQVALDWLGEHGYTRAVTTGVDGYNSASWNAIQYRGFRYWPISEQIREFGWQWVKLVLAISPTRGIGTFVLQKPFDKTLPYEFEQTHGLGSLASVILLVGCLLLPLSQLGRMLWGKATIVDPHLTNLLLGTGILALYLSVRALAHWLAARAMGVPLSFRIWDTGLEQAAVVAAVFGLFFPGVSGGYYIRRAKVIYNHVRDTMGQIMLAGVASSLFLLTAFTLWDGSTGHGLSAIRVLGRYVGASLGLTDTLLVFWPFQAAPARHLWAWRRGVWLLMTVCFLVVWLVLPRVL